MLAVPIGCGKCMECKKLKSREWRVRLLEEVRHNKKGIFITLTFSNESIKELYKDIHNLEGYELDNEIVTKATRRFLERIRKETRKSVKHWLISELGHNGTENVHLHGIIWTENRELISKHWKYGYIWMSDKKKGYVNEQTVNYITKYITKVDLDHKNYNPKILCSKGIGKGYLERPDAQNNKYKAGETKEYYKTRSIIVTGNSECNILTS